jgi:alpha-tubulin suppressor-like RCC1 family protein
MGRCGNPLRQNSLNALIGVCASFAILSTECSSRTEINAPPALEISATAVDFGDVLCGDEQTENVILSNAAQPNQGALGWTASVEGSFSVSPSSGTIAPRDDTTITITASIPVTSTAGQRVYGALRIDSNDPAHPSTLVPLQLTAHGAAFVATQPAVDFGQVPASYTGIADVYVENVGDEPATVSVEAPPVTDIILNPKPTMYALVPGKSVEVGVQFTPSVNESVNTSAAIVTSDAACAPKLTSLTLRGVGLDGVVGVTPGSIDFGQVACGTAAQPKTFEIFNVGNAPFDFDISLPGKTYSVTPTSGTVAPQTATTITVTPSLVGPLTTIAPTAFDYIAIITTTAAQDASFHEVALHEEPYGAIVSVAPSPLAFDKVYVAAPKSLPLTITNAGNAPTTVSFTTSPPFEAPSSTTVPAQSNIVVQPTFSPDGKNLGDNVKGSLVVSASGPLCNAQPSAIALSGTGIDAAVSVAVGEYHSCAVGTTGHLYCWGSNSYGELGDGSSSGTSYVTPTLISPNVASSVAAAWESSCMVTLAGDVKCWGSDDYGQLGDGNTTTSFTPITVAGVNDVTDLVVGGATFCALASTGPICWGFNSQGEFGNGTTSTVTSPTQAFGNPTNVASIAAGNWNACILQSGEVECAGNNDQGELGDGTTTSSTTPVDVVNVSTATSITCSAGACCVVLTGGGVSCWGAGVFLGDGSTVDSSVPVSADISNVIAIDSTGGSTAMCAIEQDGTLWCWGENEDDALGNNSYPYSLVPTQVKISNVTSVAAGDSHSCAIVVGGGLSCWGARALGAYVNGVTYNPVEVVGFN